MYSESGVAEKKVRPSSASSRWPRSSTCVPFARCVRVDERRWPPICSRSPEMGGMMLLLKVDAAFVQCAVADFAPLVVAPGVADRGVGIGCKRERPTATHD